MCVIGRNRRMTRVAKLKPMLIALGADPKGMKAVQLTRLPGCYRDQTGPAVRKMTICIALIGWSTGARSIAVSNPLRAVDGQIYNIEKSVLWKSLDGDIVKVLTNGIVVRTFTVEAKQQAVVERRATFAMGSPTGGFHDETKLVNVGTQKVPSKKIIIQNYPDENNPAVGQTLSSIKAMLVGTTDYNGDRLELWDYGKLPTPDDFKRLKDKNDAQQQAAQKQLDEQRRIDLEKKKVADAEDLKRDMALAENGESAPLRRMGERYRNCNGVPKD